jgi:hypothetical protein
VIISPHKHDWEQFKDDETKYFIKCNNGADLEEILKKIIKLLEKKKLNIDGIIIDEFDMYIKNNYDIKENLNNLVLNHRHKPYEVFLTLITRRPQDIPTKIYESSKYIYAFSLQGANAKKKFNDITKGWGDMIMSLNYDEFEYTFKEIGKPPKKFNKNDKEI